MKWWAGRLFAGLPTAGIVIVQAAIPDAEGVIDACYPGKGPNKNTLSVEPQS
jgi:hypothetical protein